MSMKDVRNAFSLLVPKKLGTRDGRTVYSKPGIRAFFLTLIANGSSVVMNAHISDPTIRDNGSGNKSFLLFNRITVTKAQQ